MSVSIGESVSIPDWNMAGVVPPVRPGEDPAGGDRSPYRIALDGFVDRFCFNADRAEIIRGLIRLRAGLHSIGMVHGFQWINGSFLENVEDREGRFPNDVDVVTYAFLPKGQTQETFFPRIIPYLDRDQVKSTYRVDHFLRVLPQLEIQDVCYWYSLWSHRRDGMWKGYAEVDLDPEYDPRAATLLEVKIGAGFGA